MIDISKGRYWDLPWSLVEGCSPCSPGCEHCWAAGMTKRFHPYEIEGDMAMPLITDDGKHFNGRIVLHPERLSIPLKRRKPTVYAVWNDLFHEEAPDRFRDDVLAVMQQTPQHTYLILTKRAYRLPQYCGSKTITSNIWLGVTVEDRESGIPRIGHLRRVKASIRFLSVEPLLQDLGKINLKGIHWVIVGGESGPGARPLHPDWVRSVRDQCQSSGVPFFFKNWGAWIPIEERGTVRYERNKTKSRIIDMETHDDLPWRKA